MTAITAAEELWQRLGGDFPPHDVPFLPAEEAAPPPGAPRGMPRNLALVLAYDGGGFAGWQAQAKARTVQVALEAALCRLCDHHLRVHASGRTDAGVHAWGQVASLVTTSRLPLPRLAAGLAALLPPEIHLRALGPVDPAFHARFSSLAKTYDYYLWPLAPASLFLRQRLWALPHPLDADAVTQALTLFVGEQDMKALASQGSEAKGPTTRRVLEASLLASPSGPWRVRLTATGFLRHAVRNLVGILSQIGQGRLMPADLPRMLAAGRRLLAGPQAPAHGLYLNRVYYQPGSLALDPGEEAVA